MKSRSITLAAALVSLAALTNAQTFQRRANISGGSDPDRGQCFVEIVVDGAAEVQIHGETASVTNLHGQVPELRRFECTRPMPPNPSEFRFRGTAGRGRQALAGDPRDTGVAMIRIDDPDSGADRYAFEISWRNGPGPGPGPISRDEGQGDRRFGRRFTTDQAVEACQGAVRTQAQQRFQTGDVTFRQTNLDDQPGRADWVVGTLEARRRGMPDQILRFSCSVNFETGQIRSAQIDPLYAEGRQGGRSGINPAALQNCQRAVGERMRRDGYSRLEFGDLHVDDRDGRSDWLVGEVRAVGQYGPESFRLSCNVDMRDGDVRSIDVSTRQQR